VLGVLAGGVSFVALPGSLVARAADGELTLVSDGAPRCQLVLPASPPAGDVATLNAAAALIVTLVKEATGVTLPVGTNDPSTLMPLYLGHRGSRTSAACSVDGLPRDGFCAEYSATAITLLGAAISGTWIATLDFTERVLKAAHLLPGPAGTDVPAAEGVRTVPAIVRDQLSFQDRRIYALGGGADFTSSNPNAVFGTRIKQFMESIYSHAMAYVYPPSKYATTLPEVYPVINGVRRIPTSDTSNAGWNPRWQDPITLQPAIDYVLAKLAEPKATGWVGLGMNDNGGYSDDTTALGTMDTDGLFSLSNVFCDWLNKVAAGVEAQLGHHNFHLGFLAYNDIRSAPDFDLHPSLVPYITRDLFGWTADDLADHDRRLIEGWSARAAELGWWDYAWGTPIMVPRLYHRALQRGLQHLRDHNVTGVFVEMDQNWGDGSKAALYGKLLWNVDVDVDAARDEWCLRTGGPAAAPHLRAFDRAWNDFWSTTMPATEYARGGKGLSYFWYCDTDYLNHVTDALIDSSQTHLDTALELAETDAQRARIAILRRQHEYYRASVRSYDRTVARPATVGEAKDLLRRMVGEIDDRVALAQRRKDLIVEFRGDPILKHSSDALTMGLTWDGLPLKSMWDIATLMRDRGPRSDAAVLWKVAERERDRTASAEVKAWLDLLLTVADGRTKNLVTNGDFSDDTIAPWQVDTASGWPGGEPSRSTTVRRQGPGSLRIVGPTTGGGVLQKVPASPGFLRSSFWFRVTPTENPFGMVTNTWLFYGADGKQLGIRRGESKALQTDMGTWREITMLGTLPEGVATVACYLSYFRFAAQTEIHVTDITYTQTDPQ